MGFDLGVANVVTEAVAGGVIGHCESESVNEESAKEVSACA